MIQKDQDGHAKMTYLPLKLCEASQYVSFRMNGSFHIQQDTLFSKKTSGLPLWPGCGAMACRSRA